MPISPLFPNALGAQRDEDGDDADHYGDDQDGHDEVRHDLQDLP
ncbi:MAG: hypothetical protein ACLQBX_01295 [Candidatus Limnocylindrales bacterium]